MLRIGDFLNISALAQQVKRRKDFMQSRSTVQNSKSKQIMTRCWRTGTCRKRYDALRSKEIPGVGGTAVARLLGCHVGT